MSTTENRKLCIIGAGGFGREVFCGFKNDLLAINFDLKNVVFLDDNPKFKNKTILNYPLCI